MDKEEFEGIVLKEKVNRLNISRIPQQTKKEFLEFAKEEFCDDYGMLFRDIWEDAKLMRKIKEMFFKNKLKIVFEK